VDDDRDIDDEDEAVCAVDGRSDDIGVGPLETIGALRVDAKRGKDVEAMFMPSFIYVVPYIGVDGVDMPR